MQILTKKGFFSVKLALSPFQNKASPNIMYAFIPRGLGLSNEVSVTQRTWEIFDKTSLGLVSGHFFALVYEISNPQYKLKLLFLNRLEEMASYKPETGFEINSNNDKK